MEGRKAEVDPYLKGVNSRLPDAVVNPAERVFNPLDASRFIQERERSAAA